MACNGIQKIGRIIRERLQVQDGFLVLLAALWAVDTTHVLPLFLLAAIVHEAGHLLALACTGGVLQQLTLTLCGAVLYCDLPPSPYARAAICLAGPAASFLLTGLAGYSQAYRLAGASALLGMFNLLPLPPLDGGMALCHLCYLNHGRFDKARQMIAIGTSVGLLIGGLLLAAHGGGIWLALSGVLVCVQAIRQNGT